MASRPGQATGLIPVKGLDRCGTVPGSHRTSLGWLLPGLVIRAFKPYKPRTVDVKTDQMISYQPMRGPAVRLPAMHLLPGERSDHRVIDGERVCEAIEALGEPGSIEARARQFALLGDPTRLALLTCIEAAGPISVSDLAAATGVNDTTVSQTLRYLRAARTVTAERDGRVIRYRLADAAIVALLSGSLAGSPDPSGT